MSNFWYKKSGGIIILLLIIAVVVSVYLYKIHPSQTLPTPVSGELLNRRTERNPEFGWIDGCFELRLRNTSDKPQSVYCFVWATNDYTNPAVRGIWPATAAMRNMSYRRQLDVTRYLDGWRAKIPAHGELIEKDCAVLLGDYAEFSREAELNSFNLYEWRLVIYDHRGRKVFDRRWAEPYP